MNSLHGYAKVKFRRATIESARRTIEFVRRDNKATSSSSDVDCCYRLLHRVVNALFLIGSRAGDAYNIFDSRMYVVDHHIRLRFCYTLIGHRLDSLLLDWGTGSEGDVDELDFLPVGDLV